MKKKGIFSSSTLHIMAMLLMLCDHMWATIFPYAEYLTCIGRIAFPIFAFMITEGFLHTSDVKKYLLRMVLFALVAEIPFNLMYASQIYYPYHQNVLWTFVIALLLLCFLKWVESKGKVWLTALMSLLAVAVGFLVGTVTMVDYYGAGVLTVLLFYFCHERKWWNMIFQALGMYLINVELLGGYYYDVVLFDYYFELVQQGFALLALIPIWLYSGERGIQNKAFQICCYAFYPVHMIVLYFVWQMVC